MLRRLHVPLRNAEDVIPHLAKPEHWKKGYSAYELAVTWAQTPVDFPAQVRLVLETAPEYQDAELVDGFFEREVKLGSPGRNSQTDLMIVAGLGSELGIIAVEGKVEESFSEFVKDWNDGDGKQRRLTGLCRTLELEPAAVGGLRYQLLHRTASAIYEAKRYRCRRALMLVHSFSKKHRWFDDFSAFSAAMGMPMKQANQCSQARMFEGISLRLAWVADKLSGAADDLPQV